MIADEPLTPPVDPRRRLGRFVIRKEMFDDDLPLVAEMLAGCIVVEAASRYDIGGIAYLAVHPSFDPVPYCETAPEYAPEVDTTYARTEMGGHVGHTFKRWVRVGL
jgi:hypothetical protein